MTPADDPEAYLNIFERTMMAVGWAPDQWAAVLISYLIRPAQQVVHTLLPADLNVYAQVRAAILKTFNLSPKAY